MKILLVEDDQELGQMLSQYLVGEGMNTDVVTHGKRALEVINQTHYDAMILDIMLPDISGIEVLRQVRQQHRLPIIMLTAKGENIDRVIGLEMGADDYMPKPCYPRELVARLRSVMRRFEEIPVAAIDNQPLILKELVLNPAMRSVTWQQQPIDLTASEFNLLELLLVAGDRVVSKDELSEKALGRMREAYDRSVDVHISNIRQKISKTTHDQIFIETVRSIGYKIR
ncbi:response regulator transcription factor [Rosenbergiella nectarea]|uniref:response regulator transcription factor n=1 Tax=Rosenbergiella nectarea TaxID=988801 RepID=UPI001BDA00C0|nr:response regulator transcription factor [Rosenbergiella nectarea]MBT0729915.1 response regulator transcription factor [Rosenbergiella nectarea subsp. apis]